MTPEDKVRRLIDDAGNAPRPSEAEWDAFVGRARRSLVMHRVMTAAAVVVVLALGGIGGRVLLAAGEDRGGNSLEPARPSDSETPGPTYFDTWFLTEEERLFPYTANSTHSDAIERAALSALLDTLPDDVEEFGGTTAIPSGDHRFDLELGENGADVELHDIQAEDLSRLAVGQIVLTVAQTADVATVAIRAGGEQVEVDGTRSFIVEDFDDLLAPIIVEEPRWRSFVDGPIVLSGTANVFEATVSYRLVNEDGTEIDSGFTTASCGSGCRGSYRVEIPYDLMDRPSDTSGFLEVFESSAEDGSPLHMMRIPLTLVGRAGSPTATPEADGGSIFLQVWFVRGEMLELNFIEWPPTQVPARTAMDLLLQGPQGPYEEDGLTRAIPPETELVDITIEDGTAEVVLSQDLSAAGDATRLAEAQIVLTLTQFDTVKRVTITQPAETLREAKPKDYEEFIPPIVVEEPEPGQSVRSGFTLRGTANVFEATVSWRLVDRDGDEIESGFTTATCGTGCRGDYSTKVEFDVVRATPATLEVFESSAEDGSPLHMVRVPVNLVPEPPS